MFNIQKLSASLLCIVSFHIEYSAFLNLYFHWAMIEVGLLLLIAHGSACRIADNGFEH